jgi:hypothetical protein
MCRLLILNPLVVDFFLILAVDDLLTAYALFVCSVDEWLFSVAWVRADDLASATVPFVGLLALATVVAFFWRPG